MEQWYCINYSDRFILQWSPALWIHTFNMSRASKYFNYICLCKFFSLYITYSFVLLHYSAFSDIILTRLLALIPTVYKFLKIRIVVANPSYIEIAIGDTRDSHIILLWQKTNRYPAIDAIIYAIENNDTLLLNLLKYVTLTMWNYL